MNDYVMFVLKDEVVPDNNMGYYREFIEAWGLTPKGEIDEIKNQDDIYQYMSILKITRKGVNWKDKNTLSNRFVLTTVSIHEDYLELYYSKRKRGRIAENVMKLMSKEIGGTQNGLQIH